MPAAAKILQGAKQSILLQLDRLRPCAHLCRCMQMLAEPLGMQSLLQRSQGWLELLLRMMYRCACSLSALPWQMPSFQGAL